MRQQPAPQSSEPVSARGQLVSLRSLSRRLAFGDLLLDSGGELTLVFKDAGRGLADALRVGDVVAVSGAAQAPQCGAPRPSLLVAAASVALAWRDARPGAVFDKRPFPANACGAPTAAAGPGDAPAASRPANAGAAPSAGRCRPQQLSSSSSEPAEGAEPCKFFVNTGRCALGALCPRAHPAGTCARAAWVAARRADRRALAAASGDPYAAAPPPGAGHGPPLPPPCRPLSAGARPGGAAPTTAATKAARSRVLAAWLARTFGAAALRCGDGVVDVAGGGGALSAELCVVHRVPTTTVDARPPPPPPCAAAARRLRQRAAADASPHGSAPPPPEVATCVPAYVRAWFGPDTWRPLCRGASLLVGLHADGATEWVVDAAARRGLPFAVVPCCVFPPLALPFALGSGRPQRRARTRDELIADLVERGGPGTRVDWLPFEGANRVVHRGARPPVAPEGGARGWDHRGGEGARWRRLAAAEGAAGAARPAARGGAAGAG